jgi:iron complex outermembrane recepter protein
MKKIVSLLFLIFTVSFAFSQTSEIKGKVVDAESNTPLPYAAIMLSPANKSTVSDLQGAYSFRISPGTYTLIVSYLGFKKWEQLVTIESGESIDINIQLVKEPFFLSGIEVIGKRQSNNVVQVQSISSQDLQLLGTGEVGEVLRSIPNVGGVRRGGAVLDPVVRGFKYSQLGVYIDGLFQIEGGCPNRMDPTVSRVDAHDIERIEVVKGPYALRYGPNLGGVIRLISHNPVFFTGSDLDFKLNAFAEVTPYLGMRQHVRLDAGNNKTSIMTYGGRTDYGNFVDGNGDVVKMNVMKYNMGLKAMHRFDENNMIKLTYNNLQGRDVLFAALPMDERSDNTWFSHIDYLGKLPFTSNKSISFSTYYAHVEHIMDNFQRPISDTVAAVSTVYAQTMGAKLQTVWSLSTQSELISGFDLQRIMKDGNRVRNMIAQAPTGMGTIPKAVDQLWNNAVIDNIGWFAEWNRKSGVHSLFASVRLDANSATSDEILVKHPMHGEIYTYGKDSISSSFLNVSAAAGYAYDISECLNAGVAIGRGVRSPDMLERFIILLPVGFDTYDYLGNPHLIPETNNEIDLNIRYEKINVGAVDFTVFYSYVQNFISGKRIPPTNQTPLSMGVLGVKEFYNADYATFSGFEFAYSTPLHKKLVFSANAAYTMGTIGEATKHIIDPSQPPNQQVVGDTLLLNDPLNEIPPFEANLNIYVNLLDRKLSLHFNSRIIASQQRVSQAFYEETTPSTVLFNAVARYNLSERVSISGGVHNLLNEYYYEHLNRRMIGSSNKIFEPGRRFFVNLSIKI